MLKTAPISLLIAFLLFFILASNLTTPSFAESFKEIPDDFKYKGIPIDPSCVFNGSGSEESHDFKNYESKVVIVPDPRYTPMRNCTNWNEKYSFNEDGYYGLHREGQSKNYKYLGKTENDIHVIAHYHTIGYREFEFVIFVQLTSFSRSLKSTQIKAIARVYLYPAEKKVNISKNMVSIEWLLGDDIYKVLSVDLNDWEKEVVFTPHNIDQGKYAYTGNINGANVKAQLKFKEKGISGHYFYNKYKKKIQLKGSINSLSEFSLNESVRGKNTGSFLGTYSSKDILSGFWSNPVKTKSLPFKLIRAKSKKELSLCKHVKSTPAIKSERQIPGKNILLSVKDNEVKIKKLDSGKADVLAKLEDLAYCGSMGCIHYHLLKNKVSTSKDGSIAVVGSNSSEDIVAWDTTEWRKIFEGGGIFDLSPNGIYLATAGHNWKDGWWLLLFKNKEENFRLEHSKELSNENNDEKPLYKGEKFFFSKDSKFLIFDEGHGFYYFYNIEKDSNIKIPCN